MSVNWEEHIDLVNKFIAQLKKRNYWLWRWFLDQDILDGFKSELVEKLKERCRTYDPALASIATWAKWGFMDTRKRYLRIYEEEHGFKQSDTETVGSLDEEGEDGQTRYDRTDAAVTENLRRFRVDEVPARDSSLPEMMQVLVRRQAYLGLAVKASLDGVKPAKYAVSAQSSVLLRRSWWRLMAT